jgi:hypothetical protein
MVPVNGMHVVTPVHALYGSATQLEPASAAQNDVAQELQVAAVPPSGMHVEVLPLLEPPPLLLVVLPELLPELVAPLELPAPLELLAVTPELLPPPELELPSGSFVAGVGLLLLLQATTSAAPAATTTDVAATLRSKWFVLITAPRNSRSDSYPWHKDSRCCRPYTCDPRRLSQAATRRSTSRARAIDTTTRARSRSSAGLAWRTRAPRIPASLRP